MDVWVEFKNASRWQAEALFRNFFPCDEDEEDIEGQDLDSVQLDDNIQVQELSRADEPKPRRVYKPVDPLTNEVPNPSSSSSPSTAGSSTIWSLATSASSLISSVSSSTPSDPPPPLPKTYSGSPIPPSSPSQPKVDKSQFGASNTAYLPPPPDDSITAKSKKKPLDRKTLAELAKTFADGVPEEEFSVAGLQGCKLASSSLFFFLHERLNTLFRRFVET